MGAPHSRRHGRLWAGVLVGALLLVVDVASAATRSASGSPSGYSWPTVDAAPLLRWSAIVAAILIPAWLVLTRRWSFRARALVVGWLLLVPAVLLAVSLLGTSNVTPTRLPQPRVTGQARVSPVPAPPATPPAATGGGTGASTVSTAGRYSLFVAAGVALIAAVAGVVLLRGGGGLERSEDEEVPLGDRRPVVAVPPAAPRNSREAVIRDYREMESALAAHGHPRSPWQTSSEYTATATAAVVNAKPAAERLTGLFELARYSPHPISETARGEADGSLAAILDDLSRPAPAITDGDA